MKYGEKMKSLYGQVSVMRGEGRTNTEIARALGISVGYVSDLVKRFEPEKLHPRGRRSSAVKTAEIRAMLAQGLRHCDIAARLGMSRSAVSAYVHRHYHEIYPPKELSPKELSAKRKALGGKKNTSLRCHTDSEMRTAYRDAADKKAQIRILAECNGMTRAEVRKVLGVKE